MTLTTYVNHLNKLITYVVNNISWLLKPSPETILNKRYIRNRRLRKWVTKRRIVHQHAMIECVATMMALYRDHRCARFIEDLSADSYLLSPILFSRFFFTDFARPYSIARLTLFDLLRPERCDETHLRITINEDENGKGLQCTTCTARSASRLFKN